MRFLAVVVVLSVAALSSAKTCPHVQVQQDFDVGQYTGKWFEIARVATRFQEDASCVTASYALQNDETYPVKVTNVQLRESSQAYEFLEGGARLADVNSTEAKLKVQFPATPTEANYWVLETDYSNFSLVYSCNENDGVVTLSSWILSRLMVLDSVSHLKLEDAIIRNNLDADLFIPTRQGGTCRYFP